MLTLLLTTLLAAPMLAVQLPFRLWTKQEVAQFFCTTTRTIDRKLADGLQLGRVEIGSGLVRFDPRKIRVPGLAPLTETPEAGSIAAFMSPETPPSTN